MSELSENAINQSSSKQPNQLPHVIERWISNYQEEHGHYAALAGFEAEIRNYHDGLSEAYSRLDIGEQIALFGFVCRLLGEEEVVNQIQELERDQGRRKLAAEEDAPLMTWCPECGPDMDVDEDGCCVQCGATATGPWADKAHAMDAENQALTLKINWLRDALEKYAEPNNWDRGTYDETQTADVFMLWGAWRIAAKALEG